MSLLPGSGFVQHTVEVSRRFAPPSDVATCHLACVRNPSARTSTPLNWVLYSESFGAQEMTEYEFHDFLTSTQMAAGQANMDFVAVFFAFVACTYLVGSKISKFQAGVLTIVYTTFSFFPIMTVQATIVRVIEVSEIQGTDDTAVHLLAVINPLVLVLAWLSSVVYLVTEQRKVRSPGAV